MSLQAVVTVLIRSACCCGVCCFLFILYFVSRGIMCQSCDSYNTSRSLRGSEVQSYWTPPAHPERRACPTRLQRCFAGWRGRED